MKLTTIHAAFEQWLARTACFQRILWQGAEACGATDTPPVTSPVTLPATPPVTPPATPFAALTHAPGAQTRLDACRTRIDGRFLVSVYTGGPHCADSQSGDLYTALALADCLLCALQDEGYLSIAADGPDTPSAPSAPFAPPRVLHLYAPAARGGRAELPRLKPARRAGPYTVHDIDIPYTTICCSC